MKNNEIENFCRKFIEIGKLGWIKSVCGGNNGVGLTFETLLGISKNELEIPDYNGIEIKTKRKNSNSYITLFSSKPEGNFYHEAQRIKDAYGYPHRKFNEFKVLNNSVFANKFNKIGCKYYFKLYVNREKQKIFLYIYDINYKLIENTVYWDFDILKEKLQRKLKKLALIKSFSKKNNGVEYFKYYDLKIYLLKEFETFIELIEGGFIRINFKLNINTVGEKIGKIHDHGTSFDILEQDILKLYSFYKHCRVI